MRIETIVYLRPVVPVHDVGDGSDGHKGSANGSWVACAEDRFGDRLNNTHLVPEAAEFPWGGKNDHPWRTSLPMAPTGPYPRNLMRHLV